MKVFELVIAPGQKCLLDGKTLVKVIKSINRSGTVFSVEIPNQSILTVERDRLQPSATDDQFNTPFNLKLTK